MSARLHRRDEAGLSLVEVLVGISLMTVVMSLVVYGVIAVHRTQRYSAQDSDTLAALRVGLDRLERELRQAREIYPDSTGSSIRFWVDYDKDNQQDSVERVTWAVIDDDEGGRLSRTTDAGGAGRPYAPVMVYDPAFAYFTYNTLPVETASLVTIELLADSVDLPDSAPARSVRTQVRLRNAPAG